MTAEHSVAYKAGFHITILWPHASPAPCRAHFQACHWPKTNWSLSTVNRIFGLPSILDHQTLHTLSPQKFSKSSNVDRYLNEHFMIEFWGASRFLI